MSLWEKKAVAVSRFQLLKVVNFSNHLKGT
jgi:hypothetical protein